MPASAKISRTRGVAAPHLLGVLVEELTRGVFRPLEATELASPFDRNAIRRAQRVVEHGVEVDVGEVDALFGAVVDALAGQIAVQVHLSEPDRVGLVVALLD